MPGDEDIPIFLRKQLIRKSFKAHRIEKAPGHYSASDWRAAIDTAWGTGLPTADELNIFNAFWNTVDQDFACFQDLDVNWDSLGTVYQTEIASGVSRGRFAAIMNHLSLALRESHTCCEDKTVRRLGKLRNSRRIDPMTRSTQGFCQGDRAAIRTCFISNDETRRVNSSPYFLSRSLII
jgi:hypothetical protein